MEQHQINLEQLKTQLRIKDELCCIKDSIEETNELLGGSDTSYVAYTEVTTILTGANDTVTFTAPVSCFEIKIQGADSTTTITITTIPALTGGNSQFTMFANDYSTYCFDNTKVSSVLIQNNSTTTVTYIINGING